MSLLQVTPCDFGECPYSPQYKCEYWCSADVPDDYEDCEEYEDFNDEWD